MTIKSGSRLVLGIALGSLFFGLTARAQTTSTDRKDFERLVYSLKGPDLYRTYCATCHGLDGKGNGPTSVVLKTKVPDLTLLAKGSGKVFPTNRVRRIISGYESILSHGSRQMPIWGPIFHQVEDDRDFGNVRLQNLIQYLESIQQKQ